MKLYDKKRIGLISISIIFGICFATYILYEQKGRIGNNELLVLGITLVVAIVIGFVLIKKGNKE
jgi:hypothetical protein